MTASRKVKVAPKTAKKTIADTGHVPAAQTKVAKSVANKFGVNRPLITPTGSALRSFWLAVMKVTGQINVTKAGLVTQPKAKPSPAKLQTAWRLLNVPYHVKNGRYSREGGITPDGVKFLNAGKVDSESVEQFVTAIKAKKAPDGYSAI